jgi:hypothetical protein
MHRNCPGFPAPETPIGRKDNAKSVPGLGGSRAWKLYHAAVYTTATVVGADVAFHITKCCPSPQILPNQLNWVENTFFYFLIFLA